MLAPGSEIVPVLVWSCTACGRPVDFTIGIGPTARHMGRRMDRHFVEVHRGYHPLGQISGWQVVRSPRLAEEDAHGQAS